MSPELAPEEFRIEGNRYHQSPNPFNDQTRLLEEPDTNDIEDEVNSNYSYGGFIDQMQKKTLIDNPSDNESESISAEDTLRNEEESEEGEEDDDDED